jgi:hypothetical protein
MVTYVAVFALLLAYAALVAAYFALRTLAKLRRATRLLAQGSRSTGGRESLIEATTRHAELTMSVAEGLESLRGYVEQVRAEALATERSGSRGGSEEGPGALRNVALVRYDAFTEMAGRMSFSLALLDDRGNGVTISALAGSTDTRVYAKGVSSGAGEHELTPEERQAVSAAMGKRRSGLLRKSA